MKASRCITRIIIFLLASFIVSSCVSPKEMTYFQDPEKVNSRIDFNLDDNLKIKPGDLLTIRVSATEQEAAQPFNLTKSVVSSDRLPGSVQLETYMVSNTGTIEFPIIGTIKVDGMTNFQLSDKIKSDISIYVRDAIVNVRILNFKISVLGEVKNPGTFTIEDDHINLAQALGMAGDLTIYGNRKNVLIMREENGEKINEYLDLTDARIVTSQYYNLRQRDVIYVEPKFSKVQSASSLGLASRYLSIASVIISLVILLTK